MIDPKLNKLTDDSKLARDERSTANTEEPVAAGGATKPRAGYSVNDTVASDANLSVGSRGTDTSGVRAGAGAGAGGTSLTPGSAGESPAAHIKPGARGTGITPLSGVDAEQKPTNYDASVESSADLAASDAAGYDPTHDEIASHAYNMWHDPGRPHGDPEEDWHRAVDDLRTSRGKAKGSSA